MVSMQSLATASLQRRLLNEGDANLGAVLRSLGALDDDTLAEVIELDGRSRMSRGMVVSLKRYLDAVPDLRLRLVALDAAIDMALRSLSGGSTPTAAAVQALVMEHPDLKTVISEAAALADALCSTSVLAAKLRPQPRLDLPAEFGARAPDGQARYLLTQCLGQGSQGQVYLATDRLLSEPDRPALVAIKVLGPALDALDARERLWEEATKARRVNHPNVVRVLDRGSTDDGSDYIVYEYVPGGDLSSFISKSGLPLATDLAVGLVSQIARGVQSAHSAGLVHCDLKPGNVMMDGLVAKVADFGVSVRLESGGAAEEVYRQGVGLGNVAFISPEQFQFQEGGATIPSDIYSLGGILFFLVTGRLPHGSTLDEVCQRHDPESQLPPLPMNTARGPVESDLEAICRRAMARNPYDRHQSAGELADDLDRWLRSEPLPWTRPSTLKRLRLAARRRPKTTAIIMLLAAGVSASTGIGIKLRHDAEEQRVARMIDKAAKEAAAGAVGETINRFEAFLSTKPQRQSLSTSVLVEGLTMQWLLDFDFLKTVNGVPEMWADRIKLGRAVLEPGGNLQPGTLDHLLWESSLAFWLVSGGSEDEAIGILARNQHAWAQKLEPSDPWLAQLHALESCAIIRQALKENAPTPDPAKLNDAEALLRTERTLFGPNATTPSAAKFRGPNEGTALHLLVLQTLVDLYSSRLHPDPDLRDQFQARLNEYVSHRKPAPKK